MAKNINHLKKLRRRTILLYLAICITVIFFRGCVVALPSIKGTVFYADGKTPVADAYVLGFMIKYSLLQVLNVGGANCDLNDVEIVKTDSNGQFKLNHYLTISLNRDDTRQFLIYKPGHSVLHYFQSGMFSFKDMNDIRVSKKIKPKSEYTLQRFNSYNNSLVSVAGNIARYADYFKYHDPEKYKANIDIFHEIYRHLMDDSDNYVNSDKIHKNMRSNWPLIIEDLHHTLEIKK